MPASIPSDSDENLVEQLRRHAGEVRALESKIMELERQKDLLQTDAVRLETELQVYRDIKNEWDWFFENSLDMLLIHDREGKTKRINPAVQQVLGYTPQEFMALNLRDIVHPDDLQRTVDHMAHIASGVDGINFECRCRHKSGECRWLAWTNPAPRYGDDSEHLYAVARDITPSKLTEQELLHRAGHDALTGLANRGSFDQDLDRALARGARGAKTVALLLIDLDGFKAINDTYGHLAGDAVLKAVAARLRADQREGDLVARLGGDEFACLIEDSDPNTLDALAARTVASVCEPVDLGDCVVNVGCSIGIATWPDCGLTSQSLFEQADHAMYKVKAAGKRGFGR